MECGRENCLCTSEVGIERDRRTFCSDYCARSAGEADAEAHSLCLCGHAGCASAESGTAIPLSVLKS
jgi:hypothetical protein